MKHYIVEARSRVASQEAHLILSSGLAGRGHALAEPSMFAAIVTHALLDQDEDGSLVVLKPAVIADHVWRFPLVVSDALPLPSLPSDISVREARNGDPRFDGWEPPRVVATSQEEVVQGTIFDLARPSPSVSMAQARVALQRAGLLRVIDEGLKSLPDEQSAEVVIAWEYATTVSRDSKLIAALSGLFKLSEQDIDDLFAVAASVEF